MRDGGQHRDRSDEGKPAADETRVSHAAPVRSSASRDADTTVVRAPDLPVECVERVEHVENNECDEHDDRAGASTALQRSKADAVGSDREAGHEPEAAPTLGARIGRYVLQRKLGQGGMGIVFLARDPELQRDVALKILRSDVFGPQTTQAQQRMLREAQAMAMLSHPNLVPIYDVGIYARTIFLAMEYVRGTTLGAWLAGEPALEDVIEVFEQAGAALQAVHDAGLVHRDFKPANVIVTPARVAKVLDLGIARKLPPAAALSSLAQDPGEQATLAGAHAPGPGIDAFEAQLTQQGALVGTPAYMAPEQVTGDRIGPAIDQFAFSAALFEALTGRRPFAGGNPLATLTNVLAGKRRPWPPRCEAPESLRRAIERGLAADPGERFGSMREMLEACRQGLGVRGQIRALTSAWLARGKSPECLLAQGAQLDEARALLHDRPGAFSAQQTDFVRASVAAERRLRTRRRVLLGGLATLAVGLIPTLGLLKRRSAQLEAAKYAQVTAHIDAVRRRVLPVLDDAHDRLRLMFAQRFAWWPQFEALQLAAAGPAPLRDARLLGAITRLNDYFRPLVAQAHIVSSLHVASETGMGLLVFEDLDAQGLDPSYRFYNRLVDGEIFGDSAFEVFWSDTERPEARAHWLGLNELDSRGRAWQGYEPTARQWFTDAVAQPDGAFTWTSPYLFFTTKEPGITGATAFTRDGVRYVLAVDFTLSDLSAITTDVGATDYLVFIVTRSGEVLGLPNDPRFDTSAKVRAFFATAGQGANATLPTVESLGIPLLDVAVRPDTADSETYYVEFRGRQTLVARAPVGDARLGVTIYVVERPA